MSSASGFLCGSSEYSPSISDSKIRRSAFVNDATIADNVSLSPNCISYVLTVSFSFTIGTTSSPNSSSNVFAAFFRDTGFIIVFFVIKI